MLSFNKDSIINIYRKRAKHYDFTANLYYFIGFREQAYRRDAVEALNLKKGDTVVEIGCGTGLNFSLLQASIGPEGLIIGVDLTDKMLEQAHNRIENHGWKNVKLIHCDAAEYSFPEGIGGALSTFALTLVPEYEKVIANAALSLASGKRMVVLDFKRPKGWPMWAIRLGVFLTAPFAVSLKLAERHPWEAMRKHFEKVEMSELYLGAAYIAVGEVKDLTKGGSKVE
jgi:demethylmenaquinone methyltransferase/2-methoxy-6-polyprenyl-1,4-benzoquinol methylase